MSNPAAKQRPSRSQLAAGLACAVAAAVLFQRAGSAAQGYVKTTSLFWWWISQWLDPGAETEHGWLILGLSGWLWWRNLASDFETRRPRRVNGDEGVAAPVAAMAAGLGLHAVGFVAQQGRISIVALLVFAWGALRLAGGRRWGNAAVFPLGFMAFAIPLGGLDDIGLPLRLWVVGAGEKIAHAAGIDVIRSGTQLIAPDGRYHYDVAAPCSGVRSLTALAALSLLAGYLSFRSWWRRGALLALCFPLVYLGNVARIAAIIFAAQWGGPAWGERAHAVMGYGVFAIVLGGVLGAVSLMRRSGAAETAGGRQEAGCEGGAEGEGGMPEQKRPGERAGGAWSAAAAVILLAGGELFFLAHVASRPARGGAGVVLAADGKNPVELPTILGREWFGRVSPVTAVEREILPADTGFSRLDYRSSRDGRQVFLSIVLSGRDRTSIHRPELCLVGQGWTLRGAGAHEFSFPGAGKFPATLLRTERADAKGKTVPALAAYWFVSGDAVVATHVQRLLHDIWNRVAHGRVDRWAYVLALTDAVDGEAAALARMQAVLDGTLPTFQRPSAGTAAGERLEVSEARPTVAVP